MNKYSEIVVGNVLRSSRDGEFVILNIHGRNCKIKFLSTGFVTHSHKSNLITGSVKDKMRPYIYGVGFVGVGEHKTKVNGKPSKAYSAWKSMLHRCYGDDPKMKSYSDCTVCREWHNFQSFANWYFSNKPEDPKINEIDKDSKFDGNRVYSPKTCVFLSRKENMMASAGKISKKNQKEFLVCNESLGISENIKNLRRYCEDRGLNYKMIHGTIKTKRPYRGFIAHRLS